MISVVRLWNTLMTSARTSASGYQTADEFNQDLASVQTALQGLLAPLYAQNTYVQELLAPFVLNVTISTDKPNDCFYFIGATVNGVPAYAIRPDQASLIQSSSIRRPSATNQTAFYYLQNNEVAYIWYGTFSGEMQYIKNAPEAYIILTPVSDEERDYVVPSSGADLAWPESAFNLILAMMQQKLGLELKEEILLQFAQMGLQMETAKAEP